MYFLSLRVKGLEICISEVVRIGSTIIWVSDEKPSSSYWLMYYFWWGCRGNLKLITLGSESGSRSIGRTLARSHLRSGQRTLQKECSHNARPLRLWKYKTQPKTQHLDFHGWERHGALQDIRNKHWTRETTYNAFLWKDAGVSVLICQSLE